MTIWFLRLLQPSSHTHTGDTHTHFTHTVHVRSSHFKHISPSVCMCNTNAMWHWPFPVLLHGYYLTWPAERAGREIQYVRRIGKDKIRQTERIRAGESRHSRDGDRVMCRGDPEAPYSVLHLTSSTWLWSSKETESISSSINMCSSRLMHMQTHCLYLHFINARIPSGVCLHLSPPLLSSSFPPLPPPLLPPPLCSGPLLSLLCIPLLSPPLSYYLLSALHFSLKEEEKTSIIIWINLLRPPPPVVRQAHVHKPSSPLHFLTLIQIKIFSHSSL